MTSTTSSGLISVFFVLFSFLVPFSVWGAQASPTLDALVAEGERSNPDIFASEARWQASVARASQAGALDDPMMMMRIQNAPLRTPLDMSQEAMSARVIGISQKLPFFGKRELMQQEALHQAEADRWLVAERRLELRRMIKETWYRIYFIDRSLETVQANMLLLNDLIRLAESMYSVGKTGQQEVFQAQLQRSQLEELRIGLEQQRRSLVATINNLAYRPVETAVPPIGELTVQPYPLQAEELEQHAFADRPLLKSLQEKIDKAQAATRLAEKNIYPDVTVSLEYMQREPTASGSGDDMYTAGLTFNLPIQSDRRQAEIVENRMEQRAAVEDLAAARNEIHLKLADTLAQLERNQQQIALYEHGILDQAKGTVEAAMAGYRTDKGTFGDVLSSRMNLFNLEREYYRIVSEYLSQQAVLENIAGLSPEIK